MGKILPLLLVLSLQANAEPSYSNIHEEAPSANIETPAEIIYKHPKVKSIGEQMPLDIGKKVTWMGLTSNDPLTLESEPSGIIFGYDRNRDGIPEYQFIRRFCDFHKEVKTYAIFDVPNRTLYVDFDLDGDIDSIVNLDSLEDAILPMIPVGCEQEKAIMPSELGGK